MLKLVEVVMVALIEKKESFTKDGASARKRGRDNNLSEASHKKFKV